MIRIPDLHAASLGSDHFLKPDITEVAATTISFGFSHSSICTHVDALEFALTGNVSRLSGEGRGDVSLREHGPHVDSRNDPAKARVIVRITIPSLDKTVTIERSLKAASIPHVSPNDADVLEVLQHLKSHPEIVQLTAFLPLADTIGVVTDLPMVPQAVSDAIDKFEKTVAALPEPTKQDAARDWLTVAQERLQV